MTTADAAATKVDPAAPVPPLPNKPAAQVDGVDQQTYARVWSFVQEIGVQERHFNELQSKYRSMAAGWVLACFSAMGFVISEAIQVGVDRQLLVGGIALVGCAGVLLLWILDLLVYHRLLEACFAEGLQLEVRHPWLPRIRQNMRGTLEGKGVRLFYQALVVLFPLVAGFGFGAYLWTRDPVLAAACALAFAGAGLGLAKIIGRLSQPET
jgi:hypothetical protein